MMNGVASGSTRLGGLAVLPSGVVIATPTIATSMTATAPTSSCRPLNGPIKPCRARRCVKAGRSVVIGGSDRGQELEVLWREP
jgi:hypothetical protein